jgi:hypothetical protein
MVFCGSKLLKEIRVPEIHQRLASQHVFDVHQRFLYMYARMLIVVVAILGTTAGTARAVTVAQDQFNYGPGPTPVQGLNGGFGWLDDWGEPLGDSTPPNGFFQIVNNAAVYKGNNGGEATITQKRRLFSSLWASTGSQITVGFDLTIGAADTAFGRGIGVNFLNGNTIAFTIGKRLNGDIGIWSAGIGSTSTLLGGTLIPYGTAGTYSLSASLSYNGADSILSLTSGSNSVAYTYAGKQLGFDAVQLTGYHPSTTSNAIDNLSISVSEPIGARLTLEVDPDGNASLSNYTSTPISLDLYELISPFHNFNLSYDGLQNSPNPASGFPQGNGNGFGWEKADTNSDTRLAEAYLAGDSMLAVNQSVSLGKLFNTVNTAEPIQFTYHDTGTDTFSMGYVDFNLGSTIPGDFDNDNDVDGNDFLAWQRTDRTLAGLDHWRLQMDYQYPGDFNSNRQVEGLDFLAWQRGQSPNPRSLSDLQLWQNNYSSVVATVAAVEIPEPSSVCLMVASCGVLMVFDLPRSRRRIVAPR